MKEIITIEFPQQLGRLIGAGIVEKVTISIGHRNIVLNILNGKVNENDNHDIIIDLNKLIE